MSGHGGAGDYLAMQGVVAPLLAVPQPLPLVPISLSWWDGFPHMIYPSPFGPSCVQISIYSAMENPAAQAGALRVGFGGNFLCPHDSGLRYSFHYFFPGVVAGVAATPRPGPGGH
jgi:hypothetical protein